MFKLGDGVIFMGEHGGGEGVVAQFLGEGGLGDEGFETAGLATAAGGAVGGEDDGVADFAGAAVVAAGEAAAGDEAGADADAAVDEGEGVAVTAVAKVRFGEGHGADVVFDDDGEVELFLEEGGDGDVVPIEVGGVGVVAGGVVDEAGGAEAEAEELVMVEVVGVDEGLEVGGDGVEGGGGGLGGWEGGGGGGDEVAGEVDLAEAVGADAEVDGEDIAGGAIELEFGAGAAAAAFVERGVIGVGGDDPLFG